MIARITSAVIGLPTMQTVAPSERAVKAGEPMQLTDKQALVIACNTIKRLREEIGLKENILLGVSGSLKAAQERIGELERTCFPPGEPKWVGALADELTKFYVGDVVTPGEVIEIILKHAPSRPTATQEGEDTKRLDWLQSVLRNMEPAKGGNWLRLGDCGRIQIHRQPRPYPLTGTIWMEDECLLDSIPDATNDVRDAIDAARKQGGES